MLGGNNVQIIVQFWATNKPCFWRQQKKTSYLFQRLLIVLQRFSLIGMSSNFPWINNYFKYLNNVDF